jgi:phytoene dehydrogenase-like protein
VSDESEIILKFVRSVLAPLREAGGETRATVLRDIKALLADFESAFQTDGKSVDKQLTPSASFEQADAGSQPIASPLESWRTSVASWVARQRSIAREMEILRVLEETNGAVLLKNLHERMIVLGLSERGGQAAVVTQISRLKKTGAVAAQAQGLYSGTDGGSDRLQKMRHAYRALLVPDEVRRTV